MAFHPRPFDVPVWQKCVDLCYVSARSSVTRRVRHALTRRCYRERHLSRWQGSRPWWHYTSGARGVLDQATIVRCARHHWRVRRGRSIGVMRLSFFFSGSMARCRSPSYAAQRVIYAHHPLVFTIPFSVCRASRTALHWLRRASLVFIEGETDRHGTNTCKQRWKC